MAVIPERDEFAQSLQVEFVYSPLPGVEPEFAGWFTPFLPVEDTPEETP